MHPDTSLDLNSTAGELVEEYMTEEPGCSLQRSFLPQIQLCQAFIWFLELLFPKQAYFNVSRLEPWSLPGIKQASLAKASAWRLHLEITTPSKYATAECTDADLIIRTTMQSGRKDGCFC